MKWSSLAGIAIAFALLCGDSLASVTVRTVTPSAPLAKFEISAKSLAQSEVYSSSIWRQGFYLFRVSGDFTGVDPSEVTAVVLIVSQGEQLAMATLAPTWEGSRVTFEVRIHESSAQESKIQINRGYGFLPSAEVWAFPLKSYLQELD